MDVIAKNTPKISQEYAKLKKPAVVSAKNWENVLKLASYGGNLSKMVEGVGKYQREFEEWCINQNKIDPPSSIVTELTFVEHVALLTTFR
jgi:hypothetical protein